MQYYTIIMCTILIIVIKMELVVQHWVWLRTMTMQLNYTIIAKSKL